MRAETLNSHITPADGNVFLDLGFDPETAAELKADSDRIIDEKNAIKQSLMDDLKKWIQEKNLSKTEAAEALAVTKLRISDLLSEKTTKFSIDALVDMLARAGKQVRLSSN